MPEPFSAETNEETTGSRFPSGKNESSKGFSRAHSVVKVNTDQRVAATMAEIDNR